MKRTALGLIETFGYIGAIAGADAAVKAAVVTIKRMEIVKGGIVTVLFTGDVGAVKAAIEAGEAEASRVGKLRTSHVIASISEDVAEILFNKSKQVEIVEEKIEEKIEEVKEEVKEVSVQEEKEELEEKLEIKQMQARTVKSPGGIVKKSREELLAMKVVKLRNMARNLDGIEIEKNRIKFANKNQLVNAILAYYERRTDK